MKNKKQILMFTTLGILMFSIFSVSAFDFNDAVTVGGLDGGMFWGINTATASIGNLLVQLIGTGKNSNNENVTYGNFYIIPTNVTDSHESGALVGNVRADGTMRNALYVDRNLFLAPFIPVKTPNANSYFLCYDTSTKGIFYSSTDCR